MGVRVGAGLSVGVVLSVGVNVNVNVALIRKCIGKAAHVSREAQTAIGSTGGWRGGVEGGGEGWFGVGG